MTRPLLLGHRGARASRHVSENTLASFELCLQHGCDGFEFDVRRSSDGEAVICHDPSINGLEIKNTPAKKLAVPTLDDVLQRFSARAFLDIELKVPNLEAQVIAALREHPPHKGYVVSSFLPAVLSAIHRLDAGVPLGFLCEKRSQLPMKSGSPQPALPSGTRTDWVIPHLGITDRALVDQLHAAGNRVMVWTVNGADQMRQLARLGVDAIISDETELLAGSLS